MRTASILLALVVLGFASQSSAAKYTFRAGEQSFGFYDWKIMGDVDKPLVRGSALTLGPLGNYDTPFTATQGFVGFCLILALSIIVPTVLTVRWKRRAAC
jgi:hypothetical protein